MLAVVARNKDAASAMIIDDDTRPLLLGLNWYDDHGAVEIIRASTSRGPDGAGEKQAEATLKLIQEIGGDRNFYLDRMTDDMRAAVVRVGMDWLDMIARPTHTDLKSEAKSYHDVFGEEFYGFQLSVKHRNGFLEFIAGSGDENVLRFRAAAVDYSRSLVADALQTGERRIVEAALATAGRIDGAITRADFVYLREQEEAKYDEAEAAYQAEVRRRNGYRLAAEIGWVTGSVVLGAATGGQSVWVTTLATPLVEEMINQILDAGPPPMDQAPSTLDELLESDRIDRIPEQNYFLLSAYEQAGVSAADDYPELYRSDGTLRPLDELVTDSRASDYLLYLQEAELQSRMKLEQLDSGLQNMDRRVYDVERSAASSEYSSTPLTGAWTNDAVARQRLYGEQYVGDGVVRGWRGEIDVPEVTPDPDTYYQASYDRS